MGKLHDFLLQISTALINSRRNRLLIKDSADYLREGVYSNTVTFDCIYNKRYRSNISASTFAATRNNLFYLSRLLIKSYNCLFPYIVLHRGNQSSFEGTEMVLSSSMSEYKFFDFQKKQVLTIYKSRTKLIRIIEARARFANTFNIPKSSEVNLDCSYMIEELVPHYDYDLEVVFNQLCVLFCRHLSYYSSQIIENRDVYKDACKYYEIRFGKSELINEEAGGIMVYSHGDLWSSNIIYSGGEIYVTDFEHAGYRYFLYDFFMFIFTEWQLKNDDRLVVNYYNGLYDSHLKRMFSIVGLSFDNSRKGNYFMSFIVSILYERWQGYEIIDERIKSFICTFILSYNNDNKE